MTENSPAAGENARKFFVTNAHWPEDRDKLFGIRHEVFVKEQSVAEQLEWVGDDADFRAVLAIDGNGLPIGTGRISPDGVIGRMAVLKAWRRCGVGGEILKRLMEIGCQNGNARLKLSAQVTAIPFYERYGFEAEGAVYQDAGIDHRAMIRIVK